MSLPTKEMGIGLMHEISIPLLLAAARLHDPVH